MSDGLLGSLDTLNRKLDRILESVGALPATPAAPAAPAAPPAAAPLVDMNLILHQGRGARLRMLPRGAEVFVSAGCSGTWFFEWIEQCYGPIPRHIGVEYYSPKPHDLPANVEWIENTCSDMSSVGTGIADLVFSGQNLEHLWPEEVIGFLMEAARITKPGGLLVMDSPNRLVTEALRTWVHPEHTVEVTPDEACELLVLAGFDVTLNAGVWLNRDPASSAVLPHDWQAGSSWSVPERLVVATDHPDHSFIWWVEGRRSDRAPDGEGLRTRMAAIFATAWQERLQRTLCLPDRTQERRGGALWIRQTEESGGGPLIFGPYVPLPQGRYRCRFHLDNPGSTPVDATFEAVVAGRVLVQQARTLPAGQSQVALEFTLEKLEFGIEFRCLPALGVPLLCRKAIDLEDLEPGRYDLSLMPMGGAA